MPAAVIAWNISDTGSKSVHLRQRTVSVVGYLEVTIETESAIFVEVDLDSQAVSAPPESNSSRSLLVQSVSRSHGQMCRA